MHASLLRIETEAPMYLRELITIHRMEWIKKWFLWLGVQKNSSNYFWLFALGTAASQAKKSQAKEELEEEVSDPVKLP